MAGVKHQAANTQPPERCDEDQRRRNILGIIGEHRSVTLAPWKDDDEGKKTAGATGGSSSFDGRFVHRTHVCDGCEMRPIVGYRYHAVNAHNVDFCESCYVQALNYRGPPLWGGENFISAEKTEREASSSSSSSEEESGDDCRRGRLVFQLAQENISRRHEAAACVGGHFPRVDLRLYSQASFWHRFVGGKGGVRRRLGFPLWRSSGHFAAIALPDPLATGDCNVRSLRFRTCAGHLVALSAAKTRRISSSSEAGGPCLLGAVRRQRSALVRLLSGMDAGAELVKCWYRIFGSIVTMGIRAWQLAPRAS